MSKTVNFKAEPEGVPVPSEIFEIADGDIPVAGDNEVLMKLVSFSVDPYMRSKMRQNVKSYTPPFVIGAPMEGGAVCEVVASNIAGVDVGTRYFSMAPWSTHFILSAAALEAARPIPQGVPADVALGVLGGPGLTAYFGLNEIGAPKAGDVLVVSGAAGSTGSTVVQLGKLAGCRVVGIAGGEEKCRLVRELGADDVIDYKAAGVDLGAELDRACPDGVDIYYDNVGGNTLSAVFQRMRDFGRIIACGAISMYNDVAPVQTPLPTFLVVTRRLTFRGFIVTDFAARFGEAIASLSENLAQGKIRNISTVVKGIENAGDAFVGLFTGKNKGKMVVEV